MVCKTPTFEYNHLSAIQLHSSLFLLVFSIASVGTYASWRGQLVCTRVGNQRSRGVLIVRLQPLCSQSSLLMLRSPQIDLPLALRRSGTNPSLTICKKVPKFINYFIFLHTGIHLSALQNQFDMDHHDLYQTYYSNLIVPHKSPFEYYLNN
jgi:hypothetical protein